MKLALFIGILVIPWVSRAQPNTRTIAVVGATLIDVRDFGRSSVDIDRSVIVVKDGIVTAVGSQGAVVIPRDAEVIDGTGLFAIPGLIDGYGAIRTPGFARAYLFEGVTSVFVQQAPKGQDGEQTVTTVDGGPQVIRGSSIGGYSPDGDQSSEHPWTRHRLDDQRLSPQQLKARVDAVADMGQKAVLASFDTWPDQLDAILGEAHRRNLTVIAELAFTSYPYAIRAGVDVLVHNDRYQTGVALPQSLLAYSDDPVGMSGAPAYHDVCVASLDSALVTSYGKQLANAHTSLMPTLAIEATADDLDIPNPWLSPAAQFVHAGELDDPVDRATGQHPYLATRTPERQKSIRDCALHRQMLDGELFKQGAHFLAGSGAPAYGIMPGSGLHLELKLLHKIGLTPREALATATSNFDTLLGWKDIGFIAPGKRGDIVLLEADPRKDIEAIDQIVTVVTAGEVVDRQALLSSATDNRNNKEVK